MYAHTYCYATARVFRASCSLYIIQGVKKISNILRGGSYHQKMKKKVQ